MYTPKDLVNLRAFFDKVTLPKAIELSTGTTILDTTVFLESHFRVIETNGDKPTFAAFWQRLYQVKSLLETIAKG